MVTTQNHQVIDERIADRAAKKNDLQTEENDTEQGEEGEFKRKRRLAFLDLLLEAYDKGEITREGIREEVDTFMFEVSVAFKGFGTMFLKLSFNVPYLCLFRKLQ